MFRRPSLTLAEVAWRWSFWAAGVFLSGALLVEYSDTLPVRAAGFFFLNTGQPTLIGEHSVTFFEAAVFALSWGHCCRLGAICRMDAVCRHRRSATFALSANISRERESSQ